MELNRDQIIKALECCLVESNCMGCPLHYQYETDCLKYAGEKALSLIKKLNEENERLRDTAYRLECEVHRERADTVRKMLQRIKEDAIAVSLLSNPPKFMLEIREDALDQIAKEILEGG